jgi:hypothetical protein
VLRHKERSLTSYHQHRSKQFSSTLLPTCKLRFPLYTEPFSITVQHSSTTLLQPCHTILAAHAAVQEAHDETSIHLRWQFLPHKCSALAIYLNGIENLLISTCSRLLASLHCVMPSTAETDKAELNQFQKLANHVSHRIHRSLGDATSFDGPHAVLLRLQIQQAHDFLSELELKPPTTTEGSKATALKAKKRAPQVLFRTENTCDQLASCGDAKLLPNALDQTQGGAAAIDFSDVSLDWGLGKLVSNR